MIGRILSVFGAVLVMILSAGPVAAQAVPPELLAYPNLVILNGKVLTVDAQFTVAEAVAMRDGRILAVGSNADIKRLVGPQTRVVDAAGRSVVPGFVDSDGDNAFAGGDLYKDTMVNGKIGTRVRDDSVAAMLKQVSALVAQAEPGSPVWVRMADEWIGELSKLTARDLDLIAPTNPLSLALSSSEGVVNTLMLNRAFDAGLPRGHIGVVKNSAGQPTGQLFGAAIGMVGWNLRDWPELSDAIYESQLKINASFLRGGVTTVTGHASGYTVTIMNQLYHQGRLNLRIRPDLDFARQNPLAAQFMRRTPNMINFELGDGMIRVVGAAVGPVDGASDDGGILTHQPKVRIPAGAGGSRVGTNKWTGSSFTGRQWSDLKLDERMQTEAGTLFLMRKHGWNIGGNHNMGSQAGAIVLQTLADAEKQPDIKVKTMLGRNALDHNLIWDETSMTLAREMSDTVAFGLNAELWNPRVVRGVEMLAAQYGDGLHTSQPVRDLLKEGIRVHFEGGDPDEPPMWRAQRFITRVARYATRSERGGQAAANVVWGQQHAVTRQEALRMMTIAAAAFINEEKMLGSIEKGKYADVVILSGDYMTQPENEIERLEPVMTIVGGQVVYEMK
ncbi:MAG: amidohydrolase family protein [Acidimicrobiia bacterium]|nr:amidohydrolase family protein [Acidimicrobiia bacterium]